MDKSHQAASPVIGPSANIPAKLKSTNSFVESPSSNSCNACHSPSQPIIGSTNRTMSPYTSYNAEAKSDDMILSKNGTKLLHGPGSSPFFPNDNSPLPSNSSSPSTTTTNSNWLHGNSLKRTFNKFGGTGSPSDPMTASRNSNRTEKGGGPSMNSDQVPHTILSRSRSVNSNIDEGNSNNSNPNIARRMCSVDSQNHVKDGTTNRNVNSIKFPDQGQMRHSPRTNFTNEGRAQSESPFGGPPATFESSLPGNPVKGKLRNESASTPNARFNHLMSRTSSSNSISDLSPCSTEENASKLNKPSSLALDTLPSSAAFIPVCNNTDDTLNDLNIDDTNLLSSLNEELEGLDSIDFTGTGADRDDIGSNALDLSAVSAEDVQQTLNSAALDIPLGCPGSVNPEGSEANDCAQTDLDNLELRDILSSTTTSSSSTTVPTSSVETTSSKLIPADLDPITGSFTDNCATSTFAVTTTTTFSSPALSGGPTKSHLQEILGTADTNRLKNMARPLDPSQYAAPPSTSFSTNFNNPNKSFVGQMSTPSERPSLPMSISSPSGISPRHKLLSGNGPPFPSQRLLHRTASTPHQMPSLHNFEMNHSPIDHPSKFPPDHPMAMGPRPGMPFDQHPMHDGCPYGISSPQGTWQRSHSTSGMMGPHGMHPGMGDGGKSPRGFGGNYAPRPVNPMSGLQSTVDAIPNLGHLPKSNNMRPPHPNQRIPTPGMGEGPLSIDSRTMLPPPSPLAHDKRSVSADGSVTVPIMTKTKGSKRERGQSLDSKDDKKEPGAKKRRKSKSKDDSRKADSRVGQRLGSTADLQNSFFHVFNTETANAAAVQVLTGAVQSIVQHHSNFQGHCRLLPSKSPTLTSTGQQNPVKTELNSPHSALTLSVSAPPNGRVDTKPFPHSVPNPATPNHVAKTESSSTSGAPTPGASQVKSEAKPPQPPSTANRLKAEADAEVPNSAPGNPSPSTELPKKDENLTDEQRKHREESLTKLQRLKSQLLNNPNNNPPPPTNTESWPNPTSQSTNYAMTRYLKKVQEDHKDSRASESEDWFRLVQAYNEKRRRSRQIMNSPMDNLSSEPPPYSPAGPPHLNQRWIHGHPMREPIPSPEIPNSRFPHHGVPMRVAPDGTRFPVSYGPGRFPRGYIPGGGPNSRMAMYGGQNVPPGAILPRSSMPRLPPSHGMVPTNEAYPFSEKLKEQASMYRTEGMHNPGGPVGFDINVGDAMVGPRMGSPEWPPPYANAPGQVPLNRGMGSLPPGAMSPSCSGIGATPINPNSMPGPGMEPGLPPSVDSSMDPNMAMQMSNPGMGPSFNMTSYATKGGGNIPTYPASSMAAGKSFPSQEMRPSNNPPLDGNAGMMGDTMARRGEPRPPDLNINPNMTRSPPNFHGGRHPMPSPGMMPSQYVGGEPSGYPPGALPHMSPHPGSIPRSPMVNSPSLMKSPMGAMHMNPKVPFGAIGPMDQAAMMQTGPRSAGPTSGLPGEWNNQPPGMSTRIPQSMGGLPNNPNHKPAIQQMIDGVNRFQLPNVLYQNEVKDSISPQPMPLMVDNPGLNQDVPVLNSSRMEGPVTPGAVTMMRHPMYDSGCRSTGPRMMGPMMTENFGPEFNRPPSHSGMCMSPGPAGGPAQGMGQPVMMDGMHGGSVFISQSNMMPSNDVIPSGGVPGAGHPGAIPSSNMQRIRTEFDLSGIFPSEKPTETLSYFPSGGTNTHETSQMVTNSNMSMAMRSPCMTQQPINRYPCMGQRPLTPGATPFPGNNSGIRMPGPGSFIGSNPPGYSASVGEGYMSPSWDGVPRLQMMQNSGPSMHPNFQRPLI